MNRENRRRSGDDTAPSWSLFAKSALETLAQVSSTIAASIPDRDATGKREAADGPRSTTGARPASGAFASAESVRALVMEKIAGSPAAELLDPERVLHFLKNQAEDYWVSAVTRWESVSRDVVDDLLRDAAQRGDRKRAASWGPMARWEGVARAVAEKVVDFSMGAAGNMNPADKDSAAAEPTATERTVSEPAATKPTATPWGAEPYSGDTRDL